MYTVSEEYRDGIYSHRRTIRAKACLDGIDLTDDDSIQSLQIARPLIADNRLIGGAVSARLEMTCLDQNKALESITDGAALSLFLGLEKADGTVEWLPFQPVSVESVETDPDAHTCTVSGYDDMTKLDALTYSKVSIVYPATLRQVAQALAAAAGLTLAGDAFLLEGQVYTAEEPPNLSGAETAREVIGWIAEASLCNAVITRSGELRFVSAIPAASPAGVIDADEYFEFEPAAAYGPINTLVLGRLPQEDNIYRQDDAAIATNGSKELRINDNPFLDQRREQVIDTLFAAVNGLTVIPYTLDWRGNPAIDPGDTLQTVDSGNGTATILFGNTTLDFDGGLRADTSIEIDSLTQTDKSKATSTAEQVRKTTLEVDKANQKILAVVTSVEETQDYVNNAVEQVRQESNAALQINRDEILNAVSQVYTTQTETETLADSLESQIRQTAADVTIKFAEATEQTKAVDDRVQANKEELATYIRFSAAGIELGKVGDKMTALLSPTRLSFLDNGTEVAYISDNKLYITQGEILTNLTLGNFEFAPRSNGNLSFRWKG